MDKSYDASKSEGSSEDEWLDLSKSDYAKVIFSNLSWNPGCGDVGCYFALTETVNKNPSDYIGIYKVGHDSLSQCLAMKKLSEFENEDESKPIHCGFKSGELPELNGFYQFLYVTHENEVCGASMPFEVRHSDDKKEEVVVTERIENDFLMVRYGLEQKCYKLETLLKTHEAENIVLISEIKKLKEEKASLTQNLEKAQQDTHAVVQELTLLTKDLSLEKKKSKKAARAIEESASVHADLRKSKEDVARLEQDVRELEIAINGFATRSTELEVEIEEKKILVSDSNKMIADLKEEIKRKEIDIEGTKQLHLDMILAKDLKIEEYERRIRQLCFQMERITSELISKEKLLKAQRNNDREEKYNLMQIELENALCKKNALEREVQQLRRYPQNSREYRNNTGVSYNRLQTSEDEKLLVEELQDAKFMIKALEDSKQLAMKEMHELSEILKMTKKELSFIKCENMALKIFLEDKTATSSPGETSQNETIKEAENHKCLDKEIQEKNVHMLMNIISTLKEIEPTISMDNVEEKVRELVVNAHHQAEEIFKTKDELNLVKCENVALKISLEDKTATSSSEETLKEKENKDYLNKKIQVDNVHTLENLLPTLREINPAINMDNFEEIIRALIVKARQQARDISKLKEDCKCKSDKIDSMEKDLYYHQSLYFETLHEAQDKTARIVEAAGLYKNLYKEKEKLAKQLKKLTLMKSRFQSKKSHSKAQDNSKQTDFLALNIEKALNSSETTSNNSDSDTGEHVRAQTLYPDLLEDENYCLETAVPPTPLMVETQVKPYYECNSIDAAINNLCVDVKEDKVYKPPSKTESLCMQSLSVEEDTHIPCLICGESFLVTPYSNIPLMEHIEKKHNMDICPLCGQMFDKNVPSKYLMFHINDHFHSE